MSCLVALATIALLSVATSASAGLGQWTNITPPSGAAILAVDPVQPANVYGVYWKNGGVFKSTDHGQSWSRTAAPLIDTPGTLVVDPFMPSRLYAALGQHFGVYVSSDGGDSWWPSNTGLPNLASGGVSALALDPAAAGTVYCTVRGSGVFKSTNGGGSWAPTGTTGMANLQLSAIAVDPSNPATLYAGAQAGPSGSGGSDDAFYKSTNGGVSWTATGLFLNGLGGSTLRVYQLMIDPLTPQTIYALTGSASIQFGSAISKSTDGGATFTEFAPPVKTTWTFALDPLNPARLYAGTDEGVYVSLDGAATWTRASGEIDAVAHPVVRSLAVDPSAPSTAYAALSGDETVFKTIDGQHWASSGFGFPPDNDAETIVLDPAEPTRLYTTVRDRGLMTSSDAGAHWTARNLGLPRSGPAITDTAPSASVAIDPQTTSTIYVASGHRGIFKSVDRGTTFQPANSGLPSLDLTVIAVAPSTPSTVYAGGDGLYRSADGGGSWNATSAGLSGTVESIAVDPTTSSTVYVGTREGVFKSTDSGGSWTLVRTIPHTQTSLGGANVLVIDASAPLTVYAASFMIQPFISGSRNLEKSVDGGASWTSITTGLGSSIVTGLVIDSQTPTTLYAATRTGGVYRSVDAGANWSAFVPDPLVQFGNAIAMDPQRPSWLYVASLDGLARIEGPCVVDDDCTDGNPCTTDACNVDGSCTIESVADGTPCDDEDLCTAATACTDGRCVSNAPPTACDGGDVCNAEACSPLTGTCVAAFRPEQVPCDDGNDCNIIDRCNEGTCDGVGYVQCDACLTCMPSAGCVEAPDPTCTVPAAGKAPFTLKAQPPNGHAASWTWKSAAPMPFADFGDPLASTDYALCVYDSSAGVPSLVLRKLVTDPFCADGGCWTQSGNTLKYRVRTTVGVTGVKLKTSGSSTGLIKVKGKGLVVTGGLPFDVDPNVTVQLRRTDAPACWQATYPSVRTNTDTKFKANVP